MNNEQIKAELRRSAIEDVDPGSDIDGKAFNEAGQFCWPDGAMMDLDANQLRTFFLLVAEAL